MQNRAELVSRRSALSPARKAALEQRLRSLGAPSSAQSVATAVASAGPAPVSFEQRGLWLFEQIEPGTGFYTIFYCLKLVGSLDRAVLELSLTEVIRRHEILRTNIDTVDGVPMQLVTAPAPAHIEFEDARHRPPETREGDIAAAAQTERWRPFDLARDRLLRLKLMQFEDELHVAFLAVHHIVADGWSMRVLIGELAHFYDAHLAGRPAGLPSLPRQYREYAIWQREWIRTQSAERQLAYWQKRLDGASAALDLPFDRLRARVGTQRGDQYPIEVSGAVVGRLEAVFQRQQATLFMGLLAVYCVLLHRITGQNDIVVGCPVANRDQQQSEELIGCFANVLPTRTRINPGQTFCDLLDSVRDGMLDDLDHQNIPLDRLVEEIKARQSGEAPRMRTTLVMQPPDIELMTEKLVITQIPGLGEQRINLDLSLSLNQHGPRLVGHWRYNPGRFDRTTIARLTRWLQALMNGIAENPQSRISDLALLDDDERRNLVATWNDTASAYDTERCLHELLGEQAAARPDAVAVVYDDQHLTYQELDRRSNLLGHHLCDLGVGPEKVVGLCVDRSPEMVVGLLGILKAGGAYLPLDPAYPVQRLTHMLAETRAAILVTRTDLVDRATFTGVEVVDLDTDVPQSGSRAGNAPASRSRPENLAYVIYTSGSTGQPKGVMIQHRGVINYLTFLRRHYRLSAEDVVLQVSSISFDPSVRDIFAPLLVGARLVIPSEFDARGRKLLHEIVGKRDVSRILSITPSLLRQIAAERTRADWPTTGLRTLLPCGEALDYDLCRQIRGSLGAQVEIVNQYGPTECTMSSSFFAVDPSAELSATVPLGRPIFNARFYGLDDDFQLTPVGVAGELYIAGDGVSRGYFGRPGLTAERFMPDPFGNGARIYRTGDVVRRRPDGNLEFVARRDHQVKVRGYRIELGEIEAKLEEHTSVDHAIVIARDQGLGDQRLVAYVVGRKGAPVDAGELRFHLRRALPDYMVPSFYVALDSLPLTPNGKIDRRALPAPESGAVRGEYVAPRTPTEEVLASIWREVLKLDRVGVHDNFFDLGGHSLLAMRMTARTRAALQVELPLRVLFEAPTVRELSVRLEALQREEGGLSIPALGVQLRAGSLPLSHAQERLWLLEQLQAVGGAYHIPAAVRLSGTLDVEALERSFAELVHRHEILRTRFAIVHGSPEQVIEPLSQFQLAAEDLSTLAAEEREPAARRRAAEVARMSFDLQRGPLFRAALLRLSADEHIVVVVMHHIISDGWSIGVLIREVGALYAAYSQGQSSPLPALAVQYADYALWQRNWLQGEALDRQVAYWKQRLAGAPATLELPTDRARPAVQSYRGANHNFVLPAELTRSLNALARAEGATLFMVLLAAFNVVLSRWSGQADVVVGSPIAGRTHRELEGLIGFFVNALALRTDLNGDPSFRALIGQVKETALGAYAHQDLPFEKLVEELQPVRDLSRQPIFQVLFALQNVPQEILDLPGLRLSRIGAPHVTSKLDLSLYLHEIGGGLLGELEYATDLFDVPTIERMVEHLRMLLAGIVAGPDGRLSELPLLPDSERHRLVEEWNATSAAYPRDKCLHELFGDQAERTPDAVALVYEEQQLSYGELEKRSNQLAHHLRGLGVRPETIVGLCVERSPAMVIGLLGILKAGGAYLPLDPDYPAERLAYMVADARAKVLITKHSLEHTLPVHDGIVLRLDDDAATIACYPEQVPPCISRPDNLAYLIYTSGSTGNPKGVMGHHRGVVNRLHWDVGEGASEVYAQKTTLSFIDAIWEIFMPLIRGGRSVLVPEAAARDPDALVDELSRQGITRLVLVPSLLRAAMENVEGLAARLTALKYIVSSGEALPADLADQCLRALPDAKLLNIYGTSEFWDATWYDSGSGAGARGVPLGRTLTNMRVYVLDEGLQPSPIGVPGDLYVGGAGLARGYLGRASLTADRFIPHPFSDAGERLYRTGDVARWRADGNLEFFGRGDHQVKVRGYRIELGEVETALRACEGVRQAAVVARADNSGDKRLIAYLVLEPEQRAAASGDLRARVRHRLPEHMVPSAFIALEALPLTPSGKLDRNALPTPEVGDLAAYVAPQTPTEETLAGIWSEVLGKARVGVNENFFEAGGHSLLLIRLHRKISARFEIKIPLVALFQYPTISGFAIYLSGQASNEQILDDSRNRGARRRQSTVRRTKSERIDRNSLITDLMSKESP